VTRSYRLDVCQGCGRIAAVYGPAEHAPDCAAIRWPIRPLEGLIDVDEHWINERTGQLVTATPATATVTTSHMPVPELGREGNRITRAGIYRIPDDVYRADPVAGGSLSRSGAKSMMPPSCPAKFRHEIDYGRPFKATFDSGHAAHQVVLGVGPEIAVLPAHLTDWRKKEAADFKASARARGAVPIKAAEADEILAMAAAIKAHPEASRAFLSGSGVAELALIFRDDATGIMRRVMVDWLPHPVPGRRMVIVDYKTCERGNLDSVQKAIGDYRYNWQAEWIEDAAESLGLTDDAVVVFCFQEKTAPYLVTMVQCDVQSLMIARAQNMAAVSLYVECVEAGEWPSYSTGIPEIPLPIYQERRELEEIKTRG
jgi:hypothetical protein